MKANVRVKRRSRSMPFRTAYDFTILFPYLAEKEKPQSEEPNDSLAGLFVENVGQR